MKREKYFDTEADLCDAFMKWARKQGWVPYPETCGWDILLVNEHGHQCGVEAKLRLNLKVISQALPSMYEAYDRRGPDHRAVLVPTAEAAVVDTLRFTGVDVFEVSFRYGDTVEFRRRGSGHNLDDLFDWNPERRYELPAMVPDVRAGIPGPVQLTEWKIKALRLLALLERDGSVTREDFRRIGIDPGRWCARDGWLVPVPGKRGHWARGSVPGFDEQHPEVYAQLRAELDIEAES